ncbi:MAG: VOC family protein [Planctomycetota bacterium]|nr:VOC family protein [Planctomycetota bacterium]
MNLLHLDSLNFTTADLDGAHGFYRGLLGFVPAGSGRAGRERWVRMQSGASSLVFRQARRPERLARDPRAGFRGMAWAVESLAPYRRTLARFGELPVVLREDAEAERLTVRGPGGIGVSLVAYREPAERRKRLDGGWALLRRIDHVRLSVADLGEALAFYRGLLGFKLTRAILPDGARTRRVPVEPGAELPAGARGLILAGGEGFLSLHLNGAPRFEHMGWAVEHLDACRELLNDHQVAFVAHGSGRQLQIRDPNGFAAPEPNVELTAPRQAEPSAAMAQ